MNNLKTLQKIRTFLTRQPVLTSTLKRVRSQSQYSEMSLKKTGGRYLDIFFLTFFLFIAGTENASAYIDPGTGGMIITAILGFLGAISYTARKYYAALKNWSQGKKPESDTEEKSD